MAIILCVCVDMVRERVKTVNAANDLIVPVNLYAVMLHDAILNACFKVQNARYGSR